MAKVKPPKQKESLIATALKQKSSKADIQSDKFLNFSFRHLDTTQAASLDEWNDSGMLIKAINSIKNICSSTLKSHIGSKSIVIYGGFPKNSAYTPPSFVPEDAEWGRIHIDGVHILAGHFVAETFYIVFLDSNHTFYITQKKNT